MAKDTIIVGGYALFPVGTSGNEAYKYLGIGLELNPQSGLVMDVGTSFLSDLTERFIKDIMIGHDMNQGIAGPVEQINRRYFGKGKKAIIAALMEGHQNYKNYLAQKSPLDLSTNS